MSSDRVNTVGVVGGNGYLGSQIVLSLLKYAEEGKVKLVLFNRKGSPIKAAQGVKSEHVETREIDLEWPREKLVEAVKGINLGIAALAADATASEIHLVDALKQSPACQLYIPSMYSVTWNDADFADPKLGPIVKGFYGGLSHAKEIGLPVCQIYAGMYENWALTYGLVFPHIKENEMVANKGMLQNVLPITTPQHLGQVIARLALTPDLSSLANTKQAVVTFRPTGTDLINLFTQLHGHPTKVEDFTPQKREEKLGGGPYGPLVVGYLDKWAEDKYEYGKAGIVSHDGEYEGPGLEEVAKAHLS